MAGKTLPIKVVIGAKDEASGKVRSTLARVSASAKRASAAIGRIGIGLAKIGIAAGVAALAVGVAFGKMLMTWQESADELAKLSRQVGVSVESLQEFRYAAETQGVGADTFNKSLEYLTKSLGEAKAGTGRLVTYLNATDKAFLRQVTATNSTEEALDMMLVRLSEIEDPSERAAFAVSAFGRSGLKMSRMVDGGTDALKKLREEARRNGLITTKAANDAEEFNDRITDMKAALMGVFNVIAGDLVRILTPLIAKTREWLIANRELLAGKVKAAIQGLVESLRGAWSWVQQNKDALQDMARTSFEALKATISFFKENWESVLDTVKVLTAIWIAGKLVTAIQALQGAFALVAASPHFAAIVATIAAATAMARAFDKGGENFVKNYSQQGKGVKAFTNVEQAREYAMRQMREESGRRDAASASASVRESALSNLAMPGAFGKTEVGGELVVRFENAPFGTQVGAVETRNKRVPIRADVGASRLGMVTP